MVCDYRLSGAQDTPGVLGEVFQPTSGPVPAVQLGPAGALLSGEAGVAGASAAVGDGGAAG